MFLRGGPAEGIEQIEGPSPPQFVTTPESCEAVEGDLARFTVRLVGNPIPRVIWYKDNIMQADVSSFPQHHKTP